MPIVHCHICQRDYGPEHDLDPGDKCPNCGRAFVYLSPEEEPQDDDGQKRDKDWFSTDSTDSLEED